MKYPKLNHLLETNFRKNLVLSYQCHFRGTLCITSAYYTYNEREIIHSYTNATVIVGIHKYENQQSK